MKTTELSLSLEEENALLKQVNEELSSQLKNITEQLEWLKKQLFGKKSERFIGDDRELYLPGLELPPVEEQKEAKITVPAYEKRKAKNTPLNTIVYPDDLPVEESIIDLSPEDKIDPISGKELVCIGEDVVVRLAKKSSSYFLKKTVIKKYVVPGQSEEGIKTGAVPTRVIPRCAVDESILADVLVKKFCDHLPLYRQEEGYVREQIKISRQTLANYVIHCAEALKPLYDLLEIEVKKTGNIFVDETPVDILAPGTGKTKQGFMTTMVGGQSLNPPLRIYKFFLSRKHQEFEALFHGYKGSFHSDKYGAYVKEAQDEDKKWCPCYSHIRRKYFESGESSFRTEVLTDIQRIFALEEEIKDYGPQERIRSRKEVAGPIIDELIEKNKKYLMGRVLPKAKISGAVGYFLSLVPYLKNYLEDPYARPDNNIAERALKLVVIGRKNWLFVGSEGGGEAAAIIYSLTQTCRALNVNPSEYLEDILRRIQDHAYNKLSELLPHNWKKA